MIELDYRNYKLVESFFRGEKQYIPALSVLHGHFPGRVFADDEAVPKLVVVWATGRWMYAEGNIESQQTRCKLKEFIRSVVIPDCESRNEQWFEVYTNFSNQWDELFLEEIDFLKVQKHLESVYELNLERFMKFSSEMVAASRTVQVEMRDWPILPDSYHGLPYIREEFSGKQTKGAAVKREERMLTLCKNNGFEFGREYFVDVDTFDTAERGKGYGSLAAITLISHYLEAGMLPLWETTHQNLPSHKLALKLGFQPVADYPVFAFFSEI